MPPAFPLRSAFLALPFEGDAKRAIAALHDRLLPFAEELGLQNPASPHLTLYFWRELLEIEHAQVVDVAGRIAAKAATFALAVTGADTFGSRGEDHVLFLSIAFSPELAVLKKSCPWPNVQPFHPHVTLARVRHPGRFRVRKKKILHALGKPSFPIEVDRLRLYAEIDGRKQTPLEEFVFRND